MKRLTLLLFVCGLSLISKAAQIKVIDYDDDDVELEVVLEPSEAIPQKIKSAEVEFVRMPIFNEGFLTGKEGLPETPELHRWLAVHPNSQYRIEVVPGPYKIYKNVRLYPVQPDVTEEEETVFTFKKSAYLKNKWYGDFRVRLGARAKLGEATVLPITFSPVSYHPIKKELRVFEKITVRLVNVGPKTVEEPILFSPFVSTHLAHLTLNGKDYLQRFSSVKSKQAVILHGKEFGEVAQALAQLHRNEGVKVETVEVPLGMKSKNLKTLIGEKYTQFKMDAVLLLGDENTIPLSDSGGKTGDFSYSLVSGTDQLSDIAVGRLPIKNQIQAEIILNKIRKYHELFNQGFRNKRVMLIAHGQDYPGKYTRNMETVRKSSNPLGLAFNTQYGGEKAQNQTVVDEAQKGYSIINYRGHGSSTSWSGWGSDGSSFTGKHVDLLPDEAASLSFIFNVACTNGAIQNSSTSIAEKQLFPNEKNNSLQGAVGTFGATAPSLTEVNHRFNLHLFEFLQESEDKTMGSLYSLANNKLTQNNGGKATSNTRMYLLFSDPLITPWVQ